MEDRRPRLSVVTAVVVFLAARLALLIVREPFFDELFTVWMARQPFSQIIPSLLNDSGPPLYYFLARFDSVMALRCLSLAFSCAQFVIVARYSWISALILAVYPPAALFAVDARAYALCGLFVTAGVIALRKQKLDLAAVMFVLAAYSHYYGVLFFPLPLAGEGPAKRRVRAIALEAILFIPGFMMTFNQPAAATAWNKEPIWAPLVNLSTAGRYPEALFTPAAWIVVAIALVLVFVAAEWKLASAAPVLVPIILAIAFQLAGRHIYFPMRFEAVLAGPIALWLWKARPRFAIPLALIGAYAITAGAFDHARRPTDPYREAAQILARSAKPDDTIVATGYLYLETAVAVNRPVIAWPKEQALHPGWRATVAANPADLPEQPFIWIGERGAPELSSLTGVRSIRPLFTNERTIVGLTRPLH
ncbi:MAG: hypothetical protein ACXW29_08895 [Thermoanaerobaculia bacterium]